MPRPKEIEDLQRFHVWLFASDLEKLRMLYGDNIGPTKAIRLIIRKYLSGVEERAQGGKSLLKDIEVDV